MPGGPMAPDLPGFYYDEAKGRYFRIQADHLAPSQTAASRYSQSAVDRYRGHKAVSINDSTVIVLRDGTWALN
jgi:hypothetical protein